MFIPLPDGSLRFKTNFGGLQIDETFVPEATRAMADLAQYAMNTVKYTAGAMEYRDPTKNVIVRFTGSAVGVFSDGRIVYGMTITSFLQML